MQVNIKRSFLLLLYRSFSEVFPDLNRIFLTTKPYDFILITRLIASVFTKKIVVNIQNDDPEYVDFVYQSGELDKEQLLLVLSSMEEQAYVDEHGMLDFELHYGLPILHLLEALLCNNVPKTTGYFVSESVVLEKLLLIEKKLGFTQTEEKIAVSVKSGDILNVSDNSGAKSVKVIIEVEPRVYLVSVETTSLGHQNTLPYETKCAAIFTNSIYPAHLNPTDVCLFEYNRGIGKALFTIVAKSNDVFLKDLPLYKTIQDLSFFKFNSQI